ncbi:hypothetical protein LOTGIDRAFT_224662 [Lottia gigantea]|uniref:C2H2-type domain-containing protein n=1 Tax=Lottia gigantea TaxID=225164 RepID=V4AYL8_LOTGI|nr:hypothetical protein LOTGIDRAFT_224662 [Lottia gigantea]ESP02718.1 hypothetical protein LOTGIDRAFT_224662 [Lottia gigantea]
MKPKKRKSIKDNLSCFYCCIKFKTGEELDEHETKHKDVENPFECTICGLKDISNRRRLLRHLQAHNPNSDKKKKCSVCAEVFSNALNLKLHKKTHHPGSKPHKCEYCNKPYKKRCDLEIHVRTHTGERPYTCEVCGKAFRDVGTLRMHVRTHNPHKPFVCDTCGAAFISSFYLKTHEKIHSGEKPHQCNHCGKTFTDRSSFRRHNKIHTGEKPHRCDICGKSFIQRIQLTKHRPTHEKPNESNQTQSQPQIIFTDKLDHNMSTDFTNKHNFMDQLYHVIS